MAYRHFRHNTSDIGFCYHHIAMNIYYITYIFEWNYKSIIDAQCIYLVQFLLPHTLLQKINKCTGLPHRHHVWQQIRQRAVLRLQTSLNPISLSPLFSLSLSSLSLSLSVPLLPLNDAGAESQIRADWHSLWYRAHQSRDVSTGWSVCPSQVPTPFLISASLQSSLPWGLSMFFFFQLVFFSPPSPFLWSSHLLSSFEWLIQQTTDHCLTSHTHTHTQGNVQQLFSPRAPI